MSFLGRTVSHLTAVERRSLEHRSVFHSISIVSTFPSARSLRASDEQRPPRSLHCSAAANPATIILTLSLVHLCARPATIRSRCSVRLLPVPARCRRRSTGQMFSLRAGLLVCYLATVAAAIDGALRDGSALSDQSALVASSTASSSPLAAAASFPTVIGSSHPWPSVVGTEERDVSQLSSSSLSSSLSLPLLLTALSPPTVRTVAGLCRGHGLPGSERHCLYPGGAADIRITAELHRAEGSPWPSVAELSSLSLSLLVDPLHPLQLEPPSLQVQLVAAHLQSASSLHRLAVPFWGVLSASFARVGIFDLLFVVDQSSGLLSLGNINSSVAVEVRTATDTRLPSLRASRALFLHLPLPLTLCACLVCCCCRCGGLCV